MDKVQRCIHKGMLLKRCRLSWRPRYVEMVLDPGSLATGLTYPHQLVLYDHCRHMVKNHISFEDVVTVRSCRDCHFQVFISDGKILQFRTESVESQANWMAALKVGLGKCHIFHVRVHTSGGLDHALLYSIGVNLPAHRVGQLDRVLVLASPINDINLNAWDLNRVKAFLESDVGIRMEICPACSRGGQNDRITFIMEKRFIEDCMQFLIREARIRDGPQMENGLKIYHVPHQCGYIKQPDTPAPPLPPPYTEENIETTKQSLQKEEPIKSETEPPAKNGDSGMKFHSRTMGTIKPAYPVEFWNESTRTDSFTGGSRTESLFLADGTLSVTTNKVVEGANDDFRSHLPPRTIPRTNYKSSIPARAQPYLQYQPHMYHQRQRHFEAPYQISSRIIITDSGEVQFERNIMGNVSSQQNEGFLFRKQLPVPPRGLRAPAPQNGVPNSSPLFSHRLKVNVESTVGVQAKGGESQPSGGHVSEVTSKRSPHTRRQNSVSKAPSPPPPVPPHPPYNINRERFMSSARGGYLVHKQPPVVPSTTSATVSDQKPNPQDTMSSQLLATPPTRLTQSISDTGLAARASNFSIATLFPKPNQGISSQRPVFPKRTVKRTSSDSELSLYVDRGDSPYGNWISMGNSRLTGIKSASMKRASQVSVSSDVYIIPTPPSSVASFRRSDSNPLSPSYVRESDFLGTNASKTANPLSNLADEDDNAFLPEYDGYENSDFLRQMSREASSKESQSSVENYDDVMSVRQKLKIEASNAGVTLTSSTKAKGSSKLSGITVSTSAETSVHTSNRGGEVATNPSSPSRPRNPVPQPRSARKPVPHPRRSTVSSTSSEASIAVSELGLNRRDRCVTGLAARENKYILVDETSGGRVAEETSSESDFSPAHMPHKSHPHTTHEPQPHTTHSSPLSKRVVFTEPTFPQTSMSHLTKPTCEQKSQTLPRKPPIPKPRRKTVEEPNMVAMSHLSTSEGDLGDALTGSLELKDSGYRVLSQSTHTIVYNGKETGVTDL